MYRCSLVRNSRPLSTRNAQFLVKHGGVPDEMVLEENSSMETVGNAFYTRVLHADVLNFQRIAVINNNWHMQRTRHVFKHVFSIPGSGRGLRASSTSITFIEVASGLDPDVQQQRLEREEKSIPKFAPGSAWQHATPTLEALHLWLHRENMAYSVRRLAESESRAPIDATLARSY